MGISRAGVWGFNTELEAGEQGEKGFFVVVLNLDLTGGWLANFHQRSSLPVLRNPFLLSHLDSSIYIRC